MVNWMLWYLKPFNCAQIELFVLDNSTWNYLIVYKQIINAQLNY